MINTVHLVYFSGTGGTSRVADCIDASFSTHGINVLKTVLDGGTYPEVDSDMLVVLYPVYAFNAPKPVDEWLSTAQDGNGKPAVILSISGGGEVMPNLACRVNVKRNLEKKGYRICYESMFVMPSNIFISYNYLLSAMLLKAAPKKADQIVSDIIAGKVEITNPALLGRVFSKFGNLEKRVSGLLGEKFKADENCIGCSWCADHCPRGNISMRDGRPVFGNRCILCLRCIYGCPSAAIYPRIGRFIPLKKGYDLNDVERYAVNIKYYPTAERVARGFMMKGVKKYLNDNK